MSVPAWQVSMWDTVRRNASEWSLSMGALCPLSASVNVDHEGGGVRYGQVVWGGAWDGDMIGLAWDWREVRPNVIAMADPMTVMSNVSLLDDAGLELSDSRRLICLNTIIRQLKWQAPLTEPEAARPQHMAG